MQDNQLEPPDGLKAIAGVWPRAKAHIIAIRRSEGGGFEVQEPGCEDADSVLVVSIHWLESYDVVRHARRARQSLLDLSASPSKQGVISFVRKYGQLLDFPSWVRESIPGIRPAAHIGRDAFVFQEWCRKQGYHSTADYVGWIWNHPDYVPGFQLGEPVVLYEWAGKQLETLEHDYPVHMSASTNTSRWLAARLEETRLSLAAKNDGLTVRATTLLAYLAVNTILHNVGQQPEVRACLECGVEFTIRHGRQRFCSVTHQERYKKRRQRRKEDQTNG